MAKASRAKRKAKMGRPPLPPGEKLVKVHAYVRPRIAAILDELTRKAGFEVRGSYLKDVLTRFAEDAVARGDVKVPQK